MTKVAAMELATRNRDTQAIITGGAQGLGLAVARQLATEGCGAIALVGRTRAKGAVAVAELAEHGVRAIFIEADVADVGACEAAVRSAVLELGSINALVNAAAATDRGSLIDTSPRFSIISSPPTSADPSS